MMLWLQTRVSVPLGVVLLVLGINILGVLAAAMVTERLRRR